MYKIFVLVKNINVGFTTSQVIEFDTEGAADVAYDILLNRLDYCQVVRLW